MTTGGEAIQRAVDAAPAMRRRGEGRRLGRVLKADAPLIAGAALYVLGAILLAQFLDLPLVRVVWHSPVIGAALLCFIPLFLLARLVIGIPSFHEGAMHPGPGGVLRIYLNREALLRLTIVYLCVVPFGSAFSGLKQSLPELAVGSWDTYWVELDRVVHLGWHPWEWLRPLIESAPALRAIDLAYMVWFPLLFGSVFAMAWSQHVQLRFQFLLSALLTWVLVGTLAPVAFYSVGPCFLVDLGEAPASYHELMRLLRTESERMALFATHNQAGLLEAFQRQSWLPFGGISAMPSVHVAFAALLMLLARRIHPVAGGVAGVYLALIQVGAIVFGWHYAVDGYAGALAALGLWIGCGRLATLWLGSSTRSSGPASR